MIYYFLYIIFFVYFVYYLNSKQILLKYLNLKITFSIFYIKYTLKIYNVYTFIYTFLFQVNIKCNANKN